MGGECQATKREQRTREKRARQGRIERGNEQGEQEWGEPRRRNPRKKATEKGTGNATDRVQGEKSAAARGNATEKGTSKRSKQTREGSEGRGSRSQAGLHSLAHETTRKSPTANALEWNSMHFARWEAMRQRMRPKTLSDG